MTSKRPPPPVIVQDPSTGKDLRITCWGMNERGGFHFSYPHEESGGDIFVTASVGQIIQLLLDAPKKAKK